MKSELVVRDKETAKGLWLISRNGCGIMMNSCDRSGNSLRVVADSLLEAQRAVMILKGANARDWEKRDRK